MVAVALHTTSKGRTNFVPRPRLTRATTLHRALPVPTTAHSLGTEEISALGGRDGARDAWLEPKGALGTLHRRRPESEIRAGARASRGHKAKSLHPNYLTAYSAHSTDSPSPTSK